jgi:predicted amidohydrolase
LTEWPPAVHGADAPERRPRLRVAVVEVRDAPPDMATNVRAGLASLAAAAEAGAGLVLFPELFLGGYYLDQAMAGRAGVAAAGLARFQAAVDETGTAAVVGAAVPAGVAAGLVSQNTAPISPGRAPAAPGGLLLDTAAVLRPHAAPAFAVKAHLYPGEEQWFSPGRDLWIDQIAGWPCGVAVCYEVGFPEVARTLAVAGAHLILAPAAFGRARARIWDTLTRARAIENGCYLAAAGQAGSAGGRDFLGDSRIVDPFGELVAGQSEGAAGPLTSGPHRVYLGDLEPERIAAARAGAGGWHRSLADRRPRLYGRLTDG